LDFFGLATYKDGGDHKETGTEMGRNKEKNIQQNRNHDGLLD
jgi:hypothetical protein